MTRPCDILIISDDVTPQTWPEKVKKKCIFEISVHFWSIWPLSISSDIRNWRGICLDPNFFHIECIEKYWLNRQTLIQTSKEYSIGLDKFFLRDASFNSGFVTNFNWSRRHREHQIFWNLSLLIVDSFADALLDRHAISPPGLRDEPKASRLECSNLDPLHKWHPNLNDNTWYILSLVFMFPDKGFFTWIWGLGCIKYCYSNLGAIYAKGL